MKDWSLKERELLGILKERFEKHPERHEGIKWEVVEARLKANPGKTLALLWMEETGGEPDVVGIVAETGEIRFCDCSVETPGGRRSLCYDQEAWASRKQSKPVNSALGMAEKAGVEILTEEEYRMLQFLGPFDRKTSSWVKTPDDIRKLGGALFGEWRYGRVFIFHNGSESYYQSRGFRAKVHV
jgi:hypothetical protein